MIFFSFPFFFFFTTSDWRRPNRLHKTIIPSIYTSPWNKALAARQRRQVRRRCNQPPAGVAAGATALQEVGAEFTGLFVKRRKKAAICDVIMIIVKTCNGCFSGGHFFLIPCRTIYSHFLFLLRTLQHVCTELYCVIVSTFDRRRKAFKIYWEGSTRILLFLRTYICMCCVCIIKTEICYLLILLFLNLLLVKLNSWKIF